jgi:hypothetical protein
MAITYQHSILHGRRFIHEPCQIIHLGVVEGLIWFTSFEMLDRKWIKNLLNDLYNFLGLICYWS